MRVEIAFSREKLPKDSAQSSESIPKGIFEKLFPGISVRLLGAPLIKRNRSIDGGGFLRESEITYTLTTLIFSQPLPRLSYGARIDGRRGLII
ncbi:MAG TPA: hypothetical protein DD706_19510 [Nitrospiraceae bacterium]|nr:hypothetical protein [Nitrospiraceae bacterium]